MGRPRIFSSLDADVIRLRGEGLTRPEMADAIGCSVSSVRKRIGELIASGRLERINVKPRPSRNLMGGQTPPAATGCAVGQPKTCQAQQSHILPETVRRAPGTLYRERLTDGRESPWLSIVPEARDGGKFAWKHLVEPVRGLGGSPAGQCADAGLPSTRRREGAEKMGRS